MGIYRKLLLPPLCDIAMRNHRFRPYRERVVGAAEGRVLEVGAGSGLNLAHYGAAAREVLALEPDAKLLRYAGRARRARDLPVRFIKASAEAIPLDRGSVDCVVTTWTLCTIPDASRALREMRRVLRPGGRLLFVEHGLAPEAGVARWQNRLTPVWRHIAGGCHLNRPIQALIEGAGFRFERIETGYMPGPRLLTYLYQGSATER